MTKTCTRCGETKPLDAFHRSATGKHGRNSRCADCVNAYCRTRKKASQPGDGSCVYPSCRNDAAAELTSGLCTRHHEFLSACRESPLALTDGEWVVSKGGIRRWVA